MDSCCECVCLWLRQSYVTIFNVRLWINREINVIKLPSVIKYARRIRIMNGIIESYWRVIKLFHMNFKAILKMDLCVRVCVCLPWSIRIRGCMDRRRNLDRHKPIWCAEIGHIERTPILIAQSNACVNRYIECRWVYLTLSWVSFSN